jgi:hypothetical protein
VLSTQARALTSELILQAQNTGVALDSTATVTATISCTDRVTNTNFVPLSGSSITASFGQPIKFTGLPERYFCSGQAMAESRQPGVGFSVATLSFSRDQSVYQPSQTLDLSFKAVRLVPVKLTLAVSGIAVASSKIFNYSASCTDSVSGTKYFSGSIAVGETLYLPNVVEGSECQAVANPGNVSIEPDFWIAQKPGRVASAAADSTLTMGLLGATAAALTVNATSTNPSLVQNASVTVNCGLTSAALPDASWQAVFFSVSKPVTPSASVTLDLPRGTSCQVGANQYGSSSNDFFSFPPQISPSPNITVPATGVLGAVTADFPFVPGENIEVLMQASGDAPPAGWKLSYLNFSCTHPQHSNYNYTASFENITPQVVATSRFKVPVGSRCSTIGVNFAGTTPNTVEVAPPTTAAQTLDVTQSPRTRFSMTFPIKVFNSSLVFRVTAMGGDGTGLLYYVYAPSCFLSGGFVNLYSENNNIDVLNGQSIRYVRGKAGAVCSWSVQLPYDPPAGFLWKRDTVLSGSVTLTDGETIVDVKPEMVRATRVTFTPSVTGLPSGTIWSVRYELLCKSPTLPDRDLFFNVSSSATTPIAIEEGYVCSPKANETFSSGVYQESPNSLQFVLISDSSKMPSFTVAGATQQVQVPIVFTQPARVEVKVVIPGLFPADTVFPTVSAALSCTYPGEREYSTSLYSTSAANSLVVQRGFVPGTRCRLTIQSNSSIYYWNYDEQAAAVKKHWFASASLFEVSTVAGENLMQVPLTSLDSGAVDFSVLANPLVSPQLSLPYSIVCKSPANLVSGRFTNEGIRFFTSSGFSAGGSTQGQTRRITGLPAGTVCTQEFSQTSNNQAPSGYVWVAPTMTPRSVTVVSGQVVSATVRPELGGASTLTLNVRIDDPQYSAAQRPSLQLACGNGASVPYASYQSSPQFFAQYVFTGLPTGEICRLIEVSSYAGGAWFSLGADQAREFVISGVATTAEVVATVRPLRNVQLVVTSGSNQNVQSIFEPTLTCSLAGKPVPKASYVSFLGTTISSGDGTYTFINIPEGAQCIASLARRATADQVPVFSFQALSQNFLVKAADNVVRITAKIVAATSITVTVPASSGAPSGNANVSVRCTMAGGGFESWAGTTAVVPVGGSATVTNVPAGAQCIASVAASDLPRAAPDSKWSALQFQTPSFLTSTDGSTKVSLNVSVISAAAVSTTTTTTPPVKIGATVAAADQAHAQPVPVDDPSSLAILSTLLALAVVCLRRKKRVY